MKNNKITTLLLNCLIGLLMISPALQGAGIIKAPQDPVSVLPYSPTAPEWKVSSAFGPRDPGSVGTLSHAGIDYNQQVDNDDLGIPIKALAAGTIENIEKKKEIWYVSIASSFGTLQYLHIFENSDQAEISIANTNTSKNGYSKIVLGKIKKIYNSPPLNSIQECNAIYFYTLFPNQVIDKILTTKGCEGAEVDNPPDIFLTK